jgi:hypothetical protein
MAAGRALRRSFKAWASARAFHIASSRLRTAGSTGAPGAAPLEEALTQGSGSMASPVSVRVTVGVFAMTSPIRVACPQRVYDDTQPVPAAPMAFKQRVHSRP